MIANIKDTGFIHLELITDDIDEVLVNHFSAVDPKTSYITSVEDQAWDGRHIRYFVRTKRLNYSFLNELKEVCEENGIPLDVVDSRSAPKFGPAETIIRADMLPNITLGDHQMRAIKACMANERGIHWHVTGAGKTEIMAGIIKAYPGCPTAIIVEEVIIAQQIKERLELREVVNKVGEFFAGKRPENDQLVIVGSIQSLRSPTEDERFKELKKKGTDKAWQTRRENAELLQKLVSKCHMVMVDECDRASSKQYRELFRKHSKARYIYGFSGTPFDKDRPVENLYIRELFGSVISKSDRTEMEKIGRIIPVHYYMVAMEEDGDKHDSSTNNSAIEEWMIDNGNFHKQIRKICEAFPDDGTLILVDREYHGRILEEFIPGSKFIFGKTPLKQRNAALKAFENREIKVLIGSKILKRGLDLDGGCENLILAYDGKLGSDFEQRIGRAVRQNKKGSARVFDFIWYCNRYLYRHSRERLKKIVEMGYDSTVIFSNANISGADLIKRNWVRPKSKK